MPNPLRIMVVGDSMTQGHEGDHTWRYRLWQWLQSSASSTQCQFVGPYTGTDPPGKPSPPQPPRLISDPPKPPDDSGSPAHTSGKYAADVSSKFNSEHFSTWGRQLAQAKDVIRDAVGYYEPDILLVMLGFNDIGWGFCHAQSVLDTMKEFIAQAQMAKPDVRLAISNIPQRRFMNGRQDLVDKTTEYNKRLPEFLQSLHSDRAPVEVVDLARHYSCTPESCPAGYDGLHPNILGEYEIARAFSETLHTRYGIGDGPLSVPGPHDMPTRWKPVPSNVIAKGAPMGVVVTWDPVFGARGYDIRSRTHGAADWNMATVQSNRLDTTFTVAGITWEYQVRTNVGETDKSEWSHVVSAVSRRDTPPAPKHIKTFAQDSGMYVTWSPLEGGWAIDRYAVTILDKDIPGAFIAVYGFPGTEARLSGLQKGHCYHVWVSTWAFVEGQSAGGLPAQGNSVVPS